MQTGPYERDGSCGELRRTTEEWRAGEGRYSVAAARRAGTIRGLSHPQPCEGGREMAAGVEARRRRTSKSRRQRRFRLAGRKSARPELRERHEARSATQRCAGTHEILRERKRRDETNLSVRSVHLTANEAGQRAWVLRLVAQSAISACKARLQTTRRRSGRTSEERIKQQLLTLLPRRPKVRDLAHDYTGGASAPAGDGLRGGGGELTRVWVWQVAEKVFRLAPTGLARLQELEVG